MTDKKNLLNDDEVEKASGGVNCLTDNKFENTIIGLTDSSVSQYVNELKALYPDVDSAVAALRNGDVVNSSRLPMENVDKEQLIKIIQNAWDNSRF